MVEAKEESLQGLSFFQAQMTAIESYRKEAITICSNRGYDTEEEASYIHAIDWLLLELGLFHEPVLATVSELENELERMSNHSNSFMRKAIPIMRQALLDVENYICMEV